MLGSEHCCVHFSARSQRSGTGTKSERGLRNRIDSWKLRYVTINCQCLATLATSNDQLIHSKLTREHGVFLKLHSYLIYQLQGNLFSAGVNTSYIFGLILAKRQSNTLRTRRDLEANQNRGNQ